jgi:hypothetical protein
MTSKERPVFMGAMKDIPKEIINLDTTIRDLAEELSHLADEATTLGKYDLESPDELPQYLRELVEINAKYKVLLAHIMHNIERRKNNVIQMTDKYIGRYGLGTKPPIKSAEEEPNPTII